MEGDNNMEQTKNCRKDDLYLKEESELAQLWDSKAKAYNNIIEYLRMKKIRDENLIQFKELLQLYVRELMELYK